MTSTIIDQFIVIGVNHWSATVPIREKFSLSDDQKIALLEDAGMQGIDSVIVPCTCNRTELWSMCNDRLKLERLLLQHSNGTEEEFLHHGFFKQGEEAIMHMFKVAVGLDAQILGDLQIVKQVKEAYELSKKWDMLVGEMHRLMQFIFRAHKKIRTHTELGDGAASVASAAVQFARDHFSDLTDKHILLVGTGKIGKVTCKNLVGLGAAHLTLINRNRERAEDLAERFHLHVAGFDDLAASINKADLVIVATGASQPVLTPSHIDVKSWNGKKLFLDLSVPRNIDPAISDEALVELANMDDLASTTDITYQKRKESIPQATALINEEYDAFKTWLNEQQVVPTIIALNEKLDHIRTSEIQRMKAHFGPDELEKIEYITRRIVNKITAHTIEHLKEQSDKSAQIAEVVKEMFRLEKNGAL